MDAETGLLRVAKVVSVLGWLWLAVWLAIGIAVLIFAGVTHDSLFAAGGTVVAALIGFGLAWAVAWVIQGFAQRR